MNFSILSTDPFRPAQAFSLDSSGDILTQPRSIRTTPLPSAQLSSTELVQRAALGKRQTGHSTGEYCKQVSEQAGKGKGDSPTSEAQRLSKPIAKAG